MLHIPLAVGCKLYAMFSFCNRIVGEDQRLFFHNVHLANTEDYNFQFKFCESKRTICGSEFAVVHKIKSMISEDSC